MHFPEFHSHPFQMIVLFILLNFTIMVYRTKCDLPTFIAAMNSVGSQPTALIVLFIGCIMLIICKVYGVDPTIAGGIIGVASNMLTNMFTKSHADQSGKSTQDMSVGLPIDPKSQT